MIEAGKLFISSKNGAVTDLQKSAQSGVSGIGLKNLQQRLDIIYPGAYTIHTTTEDGIYSFELVITLNTT